MTAGTRTLLVLLVLLFVSSSIAQPVIGKALPTSQQLTEEPDGELEESLLELATAAEASSIGNSLAGQQLTVHITMSDGSTVTRGITFDQTGDPTIHESGFADPGLTAQLTEPTLESIATSPEPIIAVEKAIKYDLIALSADSPSNQVLTTLGTQGITYGGQSSIMSASIDLDDDPHTDAILEIEGIDTNSDGEFDTLVRTVLRDTNNDGTLETITSERRPVATAVTGSVELDVSNDNVRDTLLRLTGTDTNTDGQLDRKRQITLADTHGDTQFDSFAETINTISSTRIVTGTWDLNNDGNVNARMEIEGVDTDDDTAFDRRILRIALNLDGQPGFESTSETTAQINPTLSISTEFDTNNDGTPDTKASLEASDANNDGGLDSQELAVVNDSDGDGVYDSVVHRNEFRRGFLANTGDPIRYLDDPQNLTLIGVTASILSMLFQLVQGG